MLLARNILDVSRRRQGGGEEGADQLFGCGNACEESGIKIQESRIVISLILDSYFLILFSIPFP